VQDGAPSLGAVYSAIVELVESTVCVSEFPRVSFFVVLDDFVGERLPARLNGLCVLLKRLPS
jgi:hypothetical protein